MDQLDELWERIDLAHKDAIASLDMGNKSRYQYHIDKITNLLYEWDGVYIDFVPKGYLNLFQPVSEDAEKTARIGYTLGLLVRVIKAALQYEGMS